MHPFIVCSPPMIYSHADTDESIRRIGVILLPFDISADHWMASFPSLLESHHAMDSSIKYSAPRITLSLWKCSRTDIISSQASMWYPQVYIPLNVSRWIKQKQRPSHLSSLTYINDRSRFNWIGNISLVVTRLIVSIMRELTGVTHPHGDFVQRQFTLVRRSVDLIEVDFVIALKMGVSMMDFCDMNRTHR